MSFLLISILLKQGRAPAPMNPELTLTRNCGEIEIKFSIPKIRFRASSHVRDFFQEPLKVDELV